MAYLNSAQNPLRTHTTMSVGEYLVLMRGGGEGREKVEDGTWEQRVKLILLAVSPPPFTPRVPQLVHVSDLSLVKDQIHRHQTRYPLRKRFVWRLKRTV